MIRINEWLLNVIIDLLIIDYWKGNEFEGGTSETIEMKWWDELMWNLIARKYVFSGRANAMLNSDYLLSTEW